MYFLRDVAASAAMCPPFMYWCSQHVLEVAQTAGKTRSPPLLETWIDTTHTKDKPHPLSSTHSVKHIISALK